MKIPKLEIKLRHFCSRPLTKESLTWPLQSLFSYLIFYFWPSPFGGDAVMLCYHHSGRFNSSSFQFWVSPRFQTQDKHPCPWNSHHCSILGHKICCADQKKVPALCTIPTVCGVSCRALRVPRLAPALRRSAVRAEAAPSLFLFSIHWLILPLKSKGVWKHLTASQRYFMRSNILSTELGARSF